MEHAASGRTWAIATPHTAATRAGAAAFAAGGNAIDAALAASITLAVTYPQACGVGGDLFAVVVGASDDPRAVISSGRAASAADPDALRALHGDRMPVRGPAPITVPGATAGWDALHAMGARLSWSDHFAVGIAAAHDGIPVARRLAEAAAWPDERALLEADPGIGEVFYPGGGPVERGTMFTQPALGRTLETIAGGGAETVYRGPVGAAYVAGLREVGSPLTTADLAAHSATVVAPVRSTWRDHLVSVAPPNSPGYSLLQILMVAERLGLDPDPAGADAGTWARVFLAAERDVRRHLADPDRMPVPVEQLLQERHLAEMLDEIAAPLPPTDRAHPTGDTIALVTADADGHAVSLIQSLFHGFGAGILEPLTGIVAHNRGACFTLALDHPGTFGPSAQPPHTLLPVALHGEHGLAGVAGTMGGYQQPQIDAQTIARAFALGDEPATVVAAARFVVDDLPDGEATPEVVAEAGIGGTAIEAIERAGFTVDRRGEHDDELGYAQLIVRSADGSLHAGSDPRADGGALAG